MPAPAAALAGWRPQDPYKGAETLAHPIVRSTLQDLLVLHELDFQAPVCFVSVYFWRLCAGS